MSNQLKSLICQRCGSGFVLTAAYQDFVRRRGGRVVVPLLCPTCFLTQGPLPKQRGTIKWFNRQRRYGFIACEIGQEAFFHQEQLMGDKGQLPHEGQAVRFHLHHPLKGPEALNIELGAPVQNADSRTESLGGPP